MGEGVGRQVPSRSLGARSLRTAGQPDPTSLTLGSLILPGMGCISAQGPGPHCGWIAPSGKEAPQSSLLPWGNGSWG